jgi:hypothetical protein
MLAFLCLSIFYIFQACKNGVLYIINGVALSLLIISILFKILHWPFGAYMPFVGLVGFVCLLIVSIFYLKNAKQNKLALIRNGIWVLIYAL